MRVQAPGSRWYAGSMEKRAIGSLQVSVVGLGTNNFGRRMDEQAAKAVVDACLDAGITHFDTADVYGMGESEEFLGRALGARRDEAVIATKFGSRDGGRPDVVRTSVEESLKRLGTDRIDLMYLHRPDADTPVADTLAALDECVKEGKVREIACSNFNAEMLREAADAVGPGAARFAAVQNQLNLLNRRDEPLLGILGELHTAYVPYFPLASGMLTGKYLRDQPPPEGTRLAAMPEDRRGAMFNDRNFEIVEKLSAWAADHGHTIGELAISWLAAKPAVASVIAGATSPEQVRSNAAAGDWTLTETEVAEVDALSS
jgi:aryl-alcohol dehydrogenase-like predicted oxidoreductase